MDTKLVVIALVAVLAVAAVGGYMLLSNDDEDYDLIIANGTAFTHEPTWIADHFGLFAEEGLRVKFVTVDGGGTGMSALLAGRVDMTVSGGDPAVRMIQNSSDAKVVGMIEYAGVTGQMSFATLDDTVDLSDPKTLLNTDGSVRIHCGMDITTAYYSNYLMYLKQAFDDSKITEAELDLLKTLKTNSKDGGIVSLEHGNIATALLSKEVEMILAADQITVAKEAGAAANPVIPIYDKLAPMPATAVFLSVSGNALENKSDAVLKAVRAYGKACDLMSGERKAEMITYCSEYGGMAVPNLTYAVSMFKWKLCQLDGVESYLEKTAFALGETGFDTTNRITYEFLLEIYPSGEFMYDPVAGTYSAYTP